ncbi:hypothetical protein PVK06_047497 [Gossypium arboreum]|uniref:Uncharacterized protein n=1 Tax=Gossypium arboreum TaxID=29729 RepID=A0ABR0MDF4_GOSAR|nr:hypothetical protein PVK06_047497 [Gossypium arboreum]
MAKKGKAKSAKFEIEENESGPLDSKPLMVLSSSDADEANEDLSLKIVEKALLVKATRFSEGCHGVSDDPGVVSVVGLASSSRGGSDVAGTSGGREQADLDLESKKIVRRKKKKTKTEKVTVAEDGNKAEMIEKVETVEEIIMANDVETVESLDSNTVDKSDNIVLRKLLTVLKGMTILVMISRKYNAMSARVLAICVVLILLIPMQEKFLVTDVAKWVILVCHVVDHVEKQRKLPIMGHLAYAISAVEEDTLHVGKRNREPSTPSERARRENREFLGYKSAPHDHGKVRKRKKIKSEEKGFSTPRKEKQRGGWIREDAGDFSNRKYTRNHWNSPSTPSTEGRKKSSGRILGSQSSKPKNSHRYSASRFSSFGNGEPRTYNWW